MVVAFDYGLGPGQLHSGVESSNHVKIPAAGQNRPQVCQAKLFIHIGIGATGYVEVAPVFSKLQDIPVQSVVTGRNVQAFDVVGGAVSAEHGVGKLKKEFLPIMFSEKQLEQMTRVKRALDPDCLLNPGDMIDMC